MRIGSYSRSHRRGTFAALCAFLATAGMGITCTPQQASAEGPQFDAEYLAREKQFGAQLASEDKQVRERLAALEKKFGKKPNIVFILGDDIGYTELGSYGGGNPSSCGDRCWLLRPIRQG